MIPGLRALALVVVMTGVAAADPEADADAAFARAAALSGPAAIDAYEAIGTARPVTRWTDDAWSEAARLAEQARDFARARRDLEQVIATSQDARLVARARGSLARIAELGGPEWDAVRAEHERLASEIYGGGDPRSALHALAELVRANPRYPRANAARLAIALGWESEGEFAEGLVWFGEAAHAATAEQGQYRRLEYVRALIRAGELDAAKAELAALDPGLVDRTSAEQARDKLATARHRARLRVWLALALALVFAGAIAMARKLLGNWRGVGRAFARPPVEVWYLAPLALLLSVVALPANPLVARAVRWIGVAGVAIAWVSGALLEAARTRGPVSARRAIVHALVVITAGAAAVYLVVDGIGLLDLLGETWRGGPQMD